MKKQVMINNLSDFFRQPETRFNLPLSEHPSPADFFINGFLSSLKGGLPKTIQATYVRENGRRCLKVLLDGALDELMFVLNFYCEESGDGFSELEFVVMETDRHDVIHSEVLALYPCPTGRDSWGVYSAVKPVAPQIAAW